MSERRHTILFVWTHQMLNMKLRMAILMSSMTVSVTRPPIIFAGPPVDLTPAAVGYRSDISEILYGEHPTITQMSVVITSASGFRFFL
jgi:hypothetical protein